jgi:hypothetical protein
MNGRSSLFLAENTVRSYNFDSNDVFPEVMRLNPLLKSARFPGNAFSGLQASPRSAGTAGIAGADGGSFSVNRRNDFQLKRVRKNEF